MWCVELSGGNVGGERVQREEEGGRKEQGREEGHSTLQGFSERNSFTLASPTAVID